MYHIVSSRCVWQPVEFPEFESQSRTSAQVLVTFLASNTSASFGSFCVFDLPTITGFVYGHPVKLTVAQAPFAGAVILPASPHISSRITPVEPISSLGKLLILRGVPASKS